MSSTNRGHLASGGAHVPPEVAKRRAFEALVTEFRDVHADDHIQATVDATFDDVDGRARYKEFVPLLTRRLARETLLDELPGHGVGFLRRRR